MYKEMKAAELLGALGDDASKWAAAFKEIHPDGCDEDTMLGWFANAIEHSHAKRTGTLPRILPDGSAFFVGDVA